MATKTATDPMPEAIPLTPEDVAHLADGSGELPKDTAARLKVFIRCADLDRVQSTWRLVQAHLEDLRQMAEDAGVELLVDAVFVYRILERLRLEDWEKPSDVLHPGVEMPYPYLLSMAEAMAARADDEEREELVELIERLSIALGDQLGDQKILEFLLTRLEELGEATANGALSQLRAIYERQRAVMAG